MNKQQLIESLKAKRFSDKILKAFEKIKREDFMPEDLKEYTYEDNAMSIGYGVTISQPYTIAFMLGLLELPEFNNKNNFKILEIGSGSGYVLALIDEISKNSEIYGIERIKELVEKSSKILKNKENIKIICGNGTKGLKKFAPYDRILISASADEIPNNLYYQLKKYGILVCPVENSIFQIKKEKGKIQKKEFPGFVFVPLIKDP